MSEKRAASPAPATGPPSAPRSKAPPWLRPLRDLYSILRWNLRGRPVIPPPSWKRRLVRRYGRRFALRVLYESGTYYGDMVAACRRTFDEIYSTELDGDLYELARERFAGVSHIHLFHGDSAVVLPRVLERIERPCLFWLDGKAMVGGVSGPVKTPVRAELAAILAHRVEGHVVLIDDARIFTGRGDYPSRAELEEAVLAARSDWVVEVRDDVVRAHAGAR